MEQFWKSLQPRGSDGSLKPSLLRNPRIDAQFCVKVTGALGELVNKKRAQDACLLLSTLSKWIDEDRFEAWSASNLGTVVGQLLQLVHECLPGLASRALNQILLLMDVDVGGHKRRWRELLQEPVIPHVVKMAANATILVGARREAAELLIEFVSGVQPSIIQCGACFEALKMIPGLIATADDFAYQVLLLESLFRVAHACSQNPAWVEQLAELKICMNAALGQHASAVYTLNPARFQDSGRTLLQQVNAANAQVRSFEIVDILKASSSDEISMGTAAFLDAGQTAWSAFIVTDGAAGPTLLSVAFADMTSVLIVKRATSMRIQFQGGDVPFFAARTREAAPWTIRVMFKNEDTLDACVEWFKLRCGKSVVSNSSSLDTPVPVKARAAGRGALHTLKKLVLSDDDISSDSDTERRKASRAVFRSVVGVNRSAFHPVVPTVAAAAGTPKRDLLDLSTRTSVAVPMPAGGGPLEHAPDLPVVVASTIPITDPAAPQVPASDMPPSSPHVPTLPVVQAATPASPAMGHGLGEPTFQAQLRYARRPRLFGASIRPSLLAQHGFVAKPSVGVAKPGVGTPGSPSNTVQPTMPEEPAAVNRSPLHTADIEPQLEAVKPVPKQSPVSVTKSATSPVTPPQGTTQVAASRSKVKARRLIAGQKSKRPNKCEQSSPQAESGTAANKFEFEEAPSRPVSRSRQQEPVVVPAPSRSASRAAGTPSVGALVVPCTPPPTAQKPQSPPRVQRKTRKVTILSQQDEPQTLEHGELSEDCSNNKQAARLPRKQLFKHAEQTEIKGDQDDDDVLVKLGRRLQLHSPSNKEDMLETRPLPKKRRTVQKPEWDVVKDANDMKVDPGTSAATNIAPPASSPAAAGAGSAPDQVAPQTPPVAEPTSTSDKASDSKKGESACVGESGTQGPIHAALMAANAELTKFLAHHVPRMHTQFIEQVASLKEIREQHAQRRATRKRTWQELQAEADDLLQKIQDSSKKARLQHQAAFAALGKHRESVKSVNEPLAQLMEKAAAWEQSHVVQFRTEMDGIIAALRREVKDTQQQRKTVTSHLGGVLSHMQF